MDTTEAAAIVAGVPTDLDEVIADDRFKIENVRSADWALAIVGDIERQVADLRDLANEYERLADKLDHKKEHLHGLLEDFALTHRTDNEKSWQLAHGTISTTKVNPTIDIVDKDELAAWLEANHPDEGLVVREVVETVKIPKNDLKKFAHVTTDGAAVVTDDGERVPAVKAVPGYISVTIAASQL